MSGFVWHKAVLPPGFRWTAADPSVLGVARLDDASHILTVLGGRGVFTMADGKEVSVVPDDVVYLPPCREMRVVGDAPFVFLQQAATM